LVSPLSIPKVYKRTVLHF